MFQSLINKLYQYQFIPGPVLGQLQVLSVTRVHVQLSVTLESKFWPLCCGYVNIDVSKSNKEKSSNKFIILVPILNIHSQVITA